MYFRLLFGLRCRAHGRNCNGILPSIWKSSTLATSFLQRYVRALSPTRSDQDKSYDRTSFFTRVLYGFLGLGVAVYSVVWGNLNAKCAGEETCCKGEKRAVNGKTPETSPLKIDSGEVRDTSCRFSSFGKIQKKKGKNARAVSFLRGNTVKRKLQFDGEEGREDEGQPKRRMQSVSVRYLFCLPFNL